MGRESRGRGIGQAGGGDGADGQTLGGGGLEQRDRAAAVGQHRDRVVVGLESGSHGGRGGGRVGDRLVGTGRPHQTDHRRALDGQAPVRAVQHHRRRADLPDAETVADHQHHIAHHRGGQLGWERGPERRRGGGGKADGGADLTPDGQRSEEQLEGRQVGNRQNEAEHDREGDEDGERDAT